MKVAKIPRIMRTAAVLDTTGLSETRIKELEKEGRFPKRIKISDRACGYLESEIVEWVNRRVLESRM